MSYYAGKAVPLEERVPKMEAALWERDIRMKDFASAILTDAMDRGDSGARAQVLMTRVAKPRHFQ